MNYPPVVKLGRHRLVIGVPHRPFVWAGPFGATGWTPILYRVEFFGLHFCWFFKQAPRRLGDPSALVSRVAPWV